ncbi:Fungal Zn(2)-Cys(6) binuclear cluster domain-containing protein [Penicillium ucsense]|uniref:Fungal Zn(2)-Cys(6) binuclear cluster domain-containing protein n=1 Tax=Penicillium ucsense TaxID=2839758 RepID=A0A8J8WJ63_9EURO|nr:Fungal Zn(2)-Cys(6) binuclear cluster domain-containing protein [Penicillium ucsense]KAF7736449.1 Fungal Zn(2)-Cys(6) binuclear cluster domain-containing protein [Penicillium ucsense]
MDLESSDHDERDAPGALTRRACDQCRLRKIRCDKRSPCSNCRSSTITCRFTGEGQKSEPRRRVLISSQYEKKIDHIEERLGGVEKTLQRLGNIEQSLRELLKTSRQPSGRLPTTGTINSLHSSVSPAALAAHVHSLATASESTECKGPGYTSNPAIEQHESVPQFEGYSSLAAHSAYAKEFLESAVSHSTPEVLSSPKIGEALTSLRQIVEMQDKQQDGRVHRGQLSGQLGSRRDIRELEMPPMPEVLSILKRTKERPPGCFGNYLPFFTVDYFISKCQAVYFATEDYSDATFIIANFGLNAIFSEFGIIENDNSVKAEYELYEKMCKDNLEAALASLNLLMPVTLDSVVALTLGAIHGIEISKPSVGWTFASTAVQMCQSLGYNRLSTMENDPIELQHRKQDLFWSAYTITNMMSLRVGRASVVQICDVDIPPPSECFVDMGIWSNVCAIWARQAIIQNDIYVNLYSPAALKGPENQRVMHARRLAGEMQREVLEPFEQIMIRDLNITDIDYIYLRSDGVSRLAILTLIYRAIPAEPGSSSTFVPECTQTARAALELHQACAGSLKEASENLRTSYMHWAILTSPFVPFIVIFCNVITTSDREDLARLEAFAASLQPLCRFSQAIDRLHSLCSMFSTVARLYVEAKTRKQAGQDNNMDAVGQEFDAYLTALGLAPATSMAQNVWGGIIPDGGASAINLGLTESGLQSQSQGHDFVGSAGMDLSAMAGMSQATQLGNWFSGNQYIMGLLEEDLVQFNPL